MTPDEKAIREQVAEYLLAWSVDQRVIADQHKNERDQQAWFRARSEALEDAANFIKGRGDIRRLSGFLDAHPQRTEGSHER